MEHFLLLKNSLGILLALGEPIELPNEQEQLLERQAN